MEYPGRIFKHGDTGDFVKAIQKRLGVQQTGFFGDTTEEFVTKFQIAHGLEADGKVGKDTWPVLFAPQPAATDIGLAALEEAHRWVGIKEKPLGSNRGPEVDAWNRRAGVTPGPESFWCMSFVYSMVGDACKKLGVANPLSRSGSCSAQAAAAKRNSRFVTGAPSKGDIFLCRGGRTGYYHTGLVASDPDDNERFDTIEGNSNSDGSANGICVAFRKKGRRIADCHFIRL